MLKFTIKIFLLSLLLQSCGDDVEGKYTDNIKLSKTLIEFDSSANSEVITTEYDGWKFDRVNNNGLESEFYRNVDEETMTYSSDWCEIEKVDGKKIIIKVFENNTYEDNTLALSLFKAGHSGYITIKQSKAK